MGALLLYFVIGSIVSVPALGYHLLRTRRELNALRAELRQRGLIAPGPDDQRPIPEPVVSDRLVGAIAAPHPIAPAVPESLATLPSVLSRQDDGHAR